MSNLHGIPLDHSGSYLSLEIVESQLYLVVCDLGLA